MGTSEPGLCLQTTLPNLQGTAILKILSDERDCWGGCMKRSHSTLACPREPEIKGNGIEGEERREDGEHMADGDPDSFLFPHPPPVTHLGPILLLESTPK